MNKATPPRRGWFFVAFSISLFVLVLLGFGPTFFARPVFRENGLNWTLVVHGLASTGWFVILILQATFLKLGFSRKHFRVGHAGWLLLAIIFILGVPVAIGALPRQVAAGEADADLLGSLKHRAQIARDMLLFATFAGLGLVGLLLRSRPESHKRWMLLTSVVLTTPGLARLSQFEVFRFLPEPIGFLGSFAILLLVPALRDRFVDGQIHPVNQWAAPATFVFVFLLLLLPELF